MMPFEMRNLTIFPIERLCFDLKLEVLEQLDARDVIELVKVNQGFQWMISSRPSIVFGHHVHEIELYLDSDLFEAINIMKLKPLEGKALEVSSVRLDVIRDFPFIKNIRSCNQLLMNESYNIPIGKNHTAFLKQLEAVNSLYLDWCAPVRLDLLSHLSIKIKRYAELPSFIRKAPSIKDLVGHFIETQLNECETVRVHCSNDDEFQFYYNAFVKTHINDVGMHCYNADIILPAILQTIVSHGIPSKNPAAAVRVSGYYLDDMKATIVVFLKGYPGMKQIKEENRQPIVALANDCDKGSRYRSYKMKTLCFRRNINTTRDCIYMVSSSQFLAFYIKPDEMIDD